jgi:hypothetical protein
MNIEATNRADEIVKFDRQTLGFDNAYQLNGDAAAALATVNEAIEVATAPCARVAECFARIVRAEILSQSMLDDQKAEGARELDQARALMQETEAFPFDALIDGANESPSSHVYQGIA